MRMEEIEHESDELKDLVRDMPEKIRARCRVTSTGPGVEIMRKHEKMPYVYILCEGECHVLTSFSDGQMYVFGRAGVQGGIQLIGEQEVLSEIEEAQATVRTATDCRFLRLYPEDFWAWINHDPHAAIILLKKLAKRLNEATREAGIDLYFSKLYQLKKYLVEQYEIEGVERLRIKTKRQQIADELGVSLRSVQRGVRVLKDQGLIEIVKGKMEIDQVGYESILDSLDQ